MGMSQPTQAPPEGRFPPRRICSAPLASWPERHRSAGTRSRAGRCQGWRSPGGPASPPCGPGRRAAPRSGRFLPEGCRNPRRASLARPGRRQRRDPLVWRRGPHPSRASAAERGRPEGASRARASPGFTHADLGPHSRMTYSWDQT
ncbi:Protein Phosphatase Ptc7 [Manis pentadactyla]|nr:Protein Phosphatase Ptc7 [Manis pentadactyla]